MVSDAEKYKEEDERNRERVNAKNELETYVYSMKQTMDEERVKEKLGEEDVASINEQVSNTLDWLDTHPAEDAEAYRGKTKALQEVINPFMSKIYDQQPPGAPEEGGFPEPGADASSTAASVEEVD